MINLHLLVDESYIEEFVQSFPAEKVRIVEHNFEENKKLFERLFDAYTSQKEAVYLYSESIQNTNEWLEKRLQS